MIPRSYGNRVTFILASGHTVATQALYVEADVVGIQSRGRLETGF